MGCEGARMALRKISLRGVAGCATRLVAGMFYKKFNCFLKIGEFNLFFNYYTSILIVFVFTTSLSS